MNQSDLLLEYFRKNPNRDIPHPEIVDWAVNEYKRRTKGGVFRDPDRAIRKMHQSGLLIKVKKGVYRYDPNYVKKRNLEDFSTTLKKEIFERDGFRCVLCLRGPKEGAELHVDHIKPKDKGGRATLDNGQTLCSEHNIMKKRYGTLDFLKKYSEKMLALAKKYDDKDTEILFLELLEVLQKHEHHKFKK